MASRGVRQSGQTSWSSATGSPHSEQTHTPSSASKPSSQSSSGRSSWPQVARASSAFFTSDSGTCNWTLPPSPLMPEKVSALTSPVRKAGMPSS
jgi:hypothetical protein